MNTSGKSFKELSIPYFGEVFDLVDEVMRKHKVAYYLVGANALSLEFLERGMKPIRATKDVDFALWLESMEQYRIISKALQQKGFAKVKNSNSGFYHPDYEVAMDLVPFGGIEQESWVRFRNKKVDLHVLGFKEVLENAKIIETEDRIIRVPPLAGMVILKIIAWADRPEDRPDDLEDILSVIELFYRLHEKEILTHHYDLIPGQGDLNEEVIGARFLGRKCHGILSQYRKLNERVLEIIQAEMKKGERSIMPRSWARKKQIEIEDALALLSGFYAGLLDEWM